jgi:hypothetical protein
MKIYGGSTARRREKKPPGNADGLPYKVSLRFSVAHVLNNRRTEEDIELIVCKGERPGFDSYELQAGVYPL